MRASMQYDLIQGRGHEPLTVGNPLFLEAISPLFRMGAGN